LGFAGHAQLLEPRARGHHDLLRGVASAAGLHLEIAARRSHGRDRLLDAVDVQPAVFLHQLGRELRAGSLAVLGIALELADVDDQAAEEIALEGSHLEPHPRGVIRAGEPGDAFSDNDQIVILCHGLLSSWGRPPAGRRSGVIRFYPRFYLRFPGRGAGLVAPAAGGFATALYGAAAPSTAVGSLRIL